MISPEDDLFGRQLPTDLDHVANSDPAWVERYWYCGHELATGGIIMDLGLGYYPNHNVMDGFAGVTCEGVQYNFRASRRLSGDPLTTAVGPLRVEVIKEFRQHRLALEANESGFAFDIFFDATTEMHEEERHVRRRNGKFAENMIRMGQFGRYSGWMTLLGRRILLTAETWYAERDHSWGIRAEMRTDEAAPPMSKYPPFFYVWCQLQFPDGGLHLYAMELAPNLYIYLSGEFVGRHDDVPRADRRVVHFTHNLVWKDDPLGQTIESGEFHLRLEDGSERTVALKALPARYFLKGGLYGGLHGWAQGADRGSLHTEHDVWQLNDPDTRRVARTLSDHAFEAHCDGKVGYGTIQYGVSQGYPRYTEVQKFPPV